MLRRRALRPHLLQRAFYRSVPCQPSGPTDDIGRDRDRSDLRATGALDPAPADVELLRHAKPQRRPAAPIVDGDMRTTVHGTAYMAVGNAMRIITSD
jgi:hypothetical protein